MSTAPGIQLKDLPENVYNLILDKQVEQKKKNKKINLSQAVIILLKEAYLKDK